MPRASDRVSLAVDVERHSSEFPEMARIARDILQHQGAIRTAFAKIDNTSYRMSDEEKQESAEIWQKNVNELQKAPWRVAAAQEAVGLLYHPVRRLAVEIILNNLEMLPNAEWKVDAAIQALSACGKYSQWENGALAAIYGHVDKVGDFSKRIKAYSIVAKSNVDPSIKEHCFKGILRDYTQHSSARDRVEAMLVVVEHGQQGSELQRQAIECGFAEIVNAEHEWIRRNFYSAIVRHAQINSDEKQLGIKGLLEHANTIAEPRGRVGSYSLILEHAKKGSSEHAKALSGMLEAIKSDDTVSNNDNCDYYYCLDAGLAILHSDVGSDVQDQALSEWKRRASLIETADSRNFIAMDLLRRKVLGDQAQHAAVDVFLGSISELSAGRGYNAVSAGIEYSKSIVPDSFFESV